MSKILIGKNNTPFIYDFSNAKSLGKKLSASDFNINKLDQSSKLYLPPEVLSPDLKLPLIGEKIDVFSLGVMLFISLYGRPPFKNATNCDHFYRYLFDKNPLNQDKFFKVHRGIQFEDELKFLFKEMLQPNPIRRPTVREIL